MRTTETLTLAWAGCILIAGTVRPAPPPAKIALTGGKIIPVVGEPIDGGTLLIEHGKIAALGRAVDVPYDAMEVDCSGKVIFPGMIDPHSARGLDVPNENHPVTPFLDVYDAIDPSRLFFEDALRDGMTSIHVIVANDCVIGGLSRVVHPIGLTPDEMTLHAPAGLKLSVAPKRGWDRMTQMATLRETFLELADYLEKRAEEKYEEELKKEDKKIDVGPDEATKRGRKLLSDQDYDDKHLNLVRLTRGELSAFVYCERAGDVAHAVTIATDNGFFDRMVLVTGPHCFKAVEEIKAAGRPVILDPELIYRERDPVTGEITETFVPRVYADAGIAFALQPNPDTSLAERYLNYQAARCVRNGILRQTALESITINSARAIGVGDLVGSIEPGKVANIVVLSGDPLDFNTWVEKVYIKGIQAYDRSTDVRLKELLGEERKEVAEPAPVAEKSEAAKKPAMGDEKGDTEAKKPTTGDPEKKDDKKEGESPSGTP